MAELQRIFDQSSTGFEAGRELMRLCQGRDTVSEYSINFQTLATDSWEGQALVNAFLHGLSEEVKDELLTQEPPEDLDHIIALATQIDSHLEDRRRMRRPRSPPPRGRYDYPWYSRLANH